MLDKAMYKWFRSTLKSDTRQYNILNNTFHLEDVTIERIQIYVYETPKDQHSKINR